MGMPCFFTGVGIRIDIFYDVSRVMEYHHGYTS